MCEVEVVVKDIDGASFHGAINLDLADFTGARGYHPGLV